ncbi:hypothetical protein DFH08DRAFT_987010 [Mycena albidolilacea]|uniref:DDE Tnp4 domain-containing protein n=1 Tax=Mycena albidolilacea TaxID=1033008 RepID=A0AAD7A9Q3_9AGAR|nr:hypothetical protein DFH08DRAFT_987010 [Mycena albidolilacea]
MFDYLVGELSINILFQSTGCRLQWHVKYQLGCFLICYSALGSDVIGTAQKLSIGYRTVFLYCHQRKVVVRQHIKDFYGFLKCLGSGDGSLIHFNEVLIEDGHLFQPRKKFFGMNIQATCDHEKRFTSFEIGWPSTVTDHRHQYFKSGEYILVDKDK